jgi:hypothetical protein
VILTERFKVLDTLMGSIVAAPNFRVVPFDSQPESLCRRNLPDESDGASVSVFDVLNAVSNVEEARCVFSIICSHYSK